MTIEAPSIGHIVVLGSSGQTGRGVADLLEARGYSVRRASRRSQWAFDWDDEKTWALPLVDARRIYVVPPQGRIDWTKFLGILSSSDIERAVVLTARNPGASGHDVAASAEDAFARSSISSTFIRSSLFSQNFITGMFSWQLDTTGQLRLPFGDAKEPFVDYRDVSAVASHALLANDAGTQGVEVSGPELLTFSEAVSVVGTITGRILTYVPISLDEWRREALGTGIPGKLLDHLTHLFRAIAEHRNEYLSTGIPDRIGRQARSLHQTVSDMFTPDLTKSDDTLNKGSCSYIVGPS